jgi:hypothetical protein
MFATRSPAICLGLGAALAVVAASATASAAPPPQIRYLDVDSVSFNSFVGIYGHGFGQNKGKVLIGAKEFTTFEQWTDTLIIARIPAGSQTGLVQVTPVGAAALTSPDKLQIHSGNVYVVSVDAPTEGSGDESSPFKTIGHALSVAIPGDTVLVKAGVYDEPDANGNPTPAVFFRPDLTGTSTKPITLRGFGSDVPTLRGSTDTARDNPIVYVGGDYIRIARVTVDGTGNKSTAISAQGSNIWIAGTDVTLFNELGIFTGEGAGVTLLGNHVHNGGLFPGVSHGIMTTGKGAFILENEIDHIDNGYGVVLQYQTQASASISDNYVHDTAGGGLGVWRVWGGNRVTNNVLWNTGLSQGCNCALEIAYGAQSGDTAVVADRIFYNTIVGPTQLAVSLSDRAGTLELHGNIFADVVGGIEVADDPSKSSLKSSDNLWFRKGSEPQFRWGAGFVDFATFKASSGMETNSLVADPLLTNQTAGDFHLLAASPAIDKGGGPDKPPTDYDGVKRPLGWELDWGAFEAPAGDGGPPNEAGPDGDANANDAPVGEGGGDAKADGNVPDGQTAEGGEEAGTAGGPPPAGDSGGCGCSTPARRSPAPLALLVGLGLLAVRSRKR